MASTNNPSAFIDSQLTCIVLLLGFLLSSHIGFIFLFVRQHVMEVISSFESLFRVKLWIESKAFTLNISPRPSCKVDFLVYVALLDIFGNIILIKTDS